MDMKPRGAEPVDRLLAAFNLVMAFTWMLALGRAGHAPALVAAHLAAVALPFLLDRAGSLSRPVALLRGVYPLLWLALFWSEVDAVRKALHTTGNDAYIMGLDAALFRSPLHETAIATFPSLWVSEPLHLAYFAYYAAIGLPLLALALQGRRAELGEAYFRLMLTYVVCFSLYALFPVDGPQNFQPFYDGRPGDGFFYRLVHAVNGAGSSLGAAFPSSHAAGAVTIAWIGWLCFSRRVALLMSVHAAAVVVATFYTQYHYAIDSLAGALLAIALQFAVAPALLGASLPEALPAPRLPVMPPCAWELDGDGGLP